VAQAEAQLQNQRDTVVAAEAQVNGAEAQLKRARAALDQARARGGAPEDLPRNGLSGGYGASSSVPPELAEARLKAARQAYEQAMKAFVEGMKEEETVYTWSRRVLDAQRDAAPGERIAALEEHLKRMADLEKLANERYKAGVIPSAGVAAAQYFRIEAETWLAQARRGGGAASSSRARPGANYSAPVGGGVRR
jgi:outer membrane protein TolC